MTTVSDPAQIFKGLLMNPVDVARADFYDPGYLVVANGRIQEITMDDPSPRYPGATLQDFTGYTILPGLIDIHVHLPQFAIMGVGGQPLLNWLLDYTYPEEARFADFEYARSISEKFFDALLANGTTCAVVYCSVHDTATDIAFEVAARKGIRAFIGKTLMDRNCPPALLEQTDTAVESSKALFDKWDGASGGRLRYIFTPRFAGACSMDLMQKTAQAAHERTAFIQSHLSESLAEVQWIRKLFPAQASYTDVYAAAGLLGPRTIMGHCIHLFLEEVTLLMQSQTKVAFCPYSNRTLRSGTMPYVHLSRAGLKIGLGSDIAGGPSLSMFQVMREALSSANSNGGPYMSPSGALYLATLGGATVLGLQNEIGSFEPGKDADFIIVDHNRADPLSGEGRYNSPTHILSRLCYNGGPDCIRYVYLQGKRQS